MELEHAFTLPRGYVAPDGTVHKDGVMRLARAGDEIEPLEDPRVRANRAYLVILLLARVITRLGPLTDVTPSIVEQLFSADLAHLQAVYRRLNGLEAERELTCPHCGRSIPPSA
jgi:hypothetical protein